MDALDLSSEAAAVLNAACVGEGAGPEVAREDFVARASVLGIQQREQALLEAVGDGLSSLTTLLLRTGARPDIRWGAKGSTLLQLAVAQADAASSAALLSGGADPSERDGTGGTVLHYAAAAGCTELFPLLLGALGVAAGASAHLDAQDASGVPPLFLACFMGNAEAASALLAAGASTSLRTSQGRTAMHYAAQGGHPALLALLLDAGADAEVQSNTGASALHTAAQDGKVEAIALLLSRGASPGSRDLLGCTPLQVALMCNKPECVRLLLPPVTPREQTNKHGLNALHVAATCAHPGLLQMVLTSYAGVDPSELDVPAKPTEVEWDLIETALHMATGRDAAGDVAALLAAGASWAVTDSKGRTPLHVAAARGCREVVRILLEAGASKAAQDASGMSADSLIAAMELMEVS